MPFLHIYNSACGLFSLGAFTDLHCVHCVSSFSSCWKEFRSWPSLLDFASSSSNQQCSFCCWKMVLDRTDPRYFARQCGVFFLCQRAFFFFFYILPYSVKLWVRWAALVVRWLRPCLGLIPKEQACISLRQSVLAASISRTLPSLSISPLPTTHSSHQSLNCYKLLFNISLAEHHLAGTSGHKELLLHIMLQAGAWNSGSVKSGCIDCRGIKAQEFLCLGSPWPPCLSCYYVAAPQLNYLKKPDVWDFAMGNLGLRG